jgi:hypothetical protein
LARIVGSLDSQAFRAAATWALAGLRPCRKRAVPVGLAAAVGTAEVVGLAEAVDPAEAVGAGCLAGIVSPCAAIQASNASTAVFF